MPGNLLGYLNFASLFLLLAAAIMGIVLLPKLSRPLKLLVLSIVVTFLLGLAATILWLQNATNLPILHVYTVAEFAALGAFYAYLAPGGSTLRTTILTLVFVGCLL